jgi:uncharacterized membrane protein
MTILTSAQLTQSTWYHILSVLFLMGGLIAVFYAISEDKPQAIIVACIFGIIGLLGIIILPSDYPINKWKYTVRIEDETKYKELIDQGYSCAQLFPGENIYEIMGDELK